MARAMALAHEFVVPKLPTPAVEAPEAPPEAPVAPPVAPPEEPREEPEPVSALAVRVGLTLVTSWCA